MENNSKGGELENSSTEEDVEYVVWVDQDCNWDNLR